MPLSVEHRAALARGEGSQRQHDHSAASLEERLQRNEVALAKPVRNAAGDADCRRVRLDQLGRKRIDRVAVATPATPLVETVDEEHLTRVSNREGEECARLEVSSAMCRGLLPERVRFARPGISQQNDVGLRQKPAESPLGSHFALMLLWIRSPEQYGP